MVRSQSALRALLLPFARRCNFYPPVGTLIRHTFDTRGSAQLNSIVWQGPKPGIVALPQGTSVQFQMAVSNNPSGPWNFIGPDGAALRFRVVASALPGIPRSSPRKQYSILLYAFQWLRNISAIGLFCFSKAAQTPTVTNVVVNWVPVD